MFSFLQKTFSARAQRKSDRQIINKKGLDDTIISSTEYDSKTGEFLNQTIIRDGKIVGIPKKRSPLQKIKENILHPKYFKTKIVNIKKREFIRNSNYVTM